MKINRILLTLCLLNLFGCGIGPDGSTVMTRLWNGYDDPFRLKKYEHRKLEVDVDKLIVDFINKDKVELNKIINKEIEFNEHTIVKEQFLTKELNSVFYEKFISAAKFEKPHIKKMDYGDYGLFFKVPKNERKLYKKGYRYVVILEYNFWEKKWEVKTIVDNYAGDIRLWTD